MNVNENFIVSCPFQSLVHSSTKLPHGSTIQTHGSMLSLRNARPDG